MFRPLYALLLVLGVVLVAAGVYHVALRPSPSPLRFLSVAPSQNTEVLTSGPWGVYDRSGTGPFGTAVVLQVSVTSAEGSAVPVAVPSSPDTLRIDGISYTESVTMHIPVTGSYVVSLTPTNSPPIRALVIKSSHPRFPWGALTIDGAILAVVGVGMTTYENRRRRTPSA